MPSALRCPTCSAPLDLPPEHATVTRCTYCGAGVLLTERGGSVQAAAQQERHTDAIAEVLREVRAARMVSAIRVYRAHFGVGLAEAKYAVERLQAGQHGWDLPEPPGTPAVPATAAAEPVRSPFEPSRPRSPLVVGAALAVLAAGGVMFFAQRDAADAAAPVPAGQVAPQRASRPSAVETLTGRGFAKRVMRFGREGTGAGRFEDARAVAVDAAGRIYVGEYSGGRVQVFDSAGTFLTQWMADTRMPLRDLEADRGGTVYVVQSGGIRRYEGGTGRVLGELPRPSGTSFDDVALALDGSLWTVTTMYEIIHLAADGRVLRTINAREVIDEDASPARVAVAGTGDVYVLDQWTGEVYHLDPTGRFRDRFGGGAGPGGKGPMSTPGDLAIDGSGRVFVSDMIVGIHVFEADGRPVTIFGRELNAFGITINDRDELFATNRNDHEVVKFRLSR